VNHLREERLEKSLDYGIWIGAELKNNREHSAEQFRHRKLLFIIIGLLRRFTDHEEECGVKDLRSGNPGVAVNRLLNKVQGDR